MAQSVRFTLLKWLIVPLLSLNLLAAGLIYWLAWIPAQLAFDQSLIDAAWALTPHLYLSSGKIENDLSTQAEQVLRVDHFDTIYLVVRDANGKTVVGDKDFPLLRSPQHSQELIAYDDVMRGEPIRIIALKTHIGTEPVLIGTAETFRKRNDIRLKIFLALLGIESILLALSVGIAWFAVGIGLYPLQVMQTKLKTRQSNDLSAVEERDAPQEVRPFVQAINGLLQRAQDGARAQQDFLANAAHQLRTPLAGLKTQLEWLQQKHANEKETSHSASLMMLATERMIRQTNQLLSLARAEPNHFESKRLELIELDKLVAQSIQHFVQEADKKGIDLGFDLQPTKILGDRFLLQDLIDNLIDNAIRYSPTYGVVTVRCFSGSSYGTIVVEDNGPGIPAKTKEKIFDRFYRSDSSAHGTGLGLAIVRDIAKDHGAKVDFGVGPHGKGTRFYVEFPFAMDHGADTVRQQETGV